MAFWPKNALLGKNYLFQQKKWKFLRIFSTFLLTLLDNPNSINSVRKWVFREEGDKSYTTL